MQVRVVTDAEVLQYELESLGAEVKVTCVPGGPDDGRQRYPVVRVGLASWYGTQTESVHKTLGHLTQGLMEQVRQWRIDHGMEP